MMMILMRMNFNVKAKKCMSNDCDFLAGVSHSNSTVDFQTPEKVCTYMSSFLPENAGDILEPTKGIGNLVKALELKGNVIAPECDFFEMEKRSFDWVVMNPPFTPMKVGYQILYDCMDMSDNIIALMPWLTLINGQKRTADIMEFGLVSITHLPRSVFNGARVQTCIMEMRKGYNESTEFLNYCAQLTDNTIKK